MFTLPPQKTGRPRVSKHCRNCGTRDFDRFDTRNRNQCIKCRQSTVESEKRLLAANFNETRLRAEKTNGNANRCLEVDEIRVFSLESFATTCQTRRGKVSSMVMGCRSCQFCHAHKLVDSGKLPDNVKLLPQTVIKAVSTRIKGAHHGRKQATTTAR